MATPATFLLFLIRKREEDDVEVHTSAESKERERERKKERKKERNKMYATAQIDH
jgi:hypothetical protein